MIFTPITVIVLFFISVFTYVLLDHYFGFGTDTPFISGLPAVSGYPLVGNLFQLGDSHPFTYMKWAKEYGPIYQVRLGTKRVVVANSFSAVKSLWVDNSQALISRPMFYTFHKLVSSTQGFTIGTSPWSDSCKKKRRAAADALKKPKVQSYMPIIDLESYIFMKKLSNVARSTTPDVDVSPYFLTYSLNTSLTLNYGTRLNEIDSQLMKEIVDVELAIGRFRSTMHNYQDYLPILRLFSTNKNKDAEAMRSRRDKYLSFFLDKLKNDINGKCDIPCIAGNVLKDPEAKINEAELKSICLTMVSAGFDTVPTNLLSGVGHLSQDYGQSVQEEAFSEIMKAYPDNDAWDKCLVEQKVDYVSALVKETVRYASVLPLCLPRKTVKPIELGGAIIPTGTIMYLNALAANFDQERYPDPFKFEPKRYLDPDRPRGVDHLGFGAGSRMCAGANLANRELYTAYIRLISAFKILPPKNKKDLMVGDINKVFANPESQVVFPEPFKVKLEPRNTELLDRWLNETSEHLGC